MTEAGRSLKALCSSCRVDVNRETSISSETEKGTWIEVLWMSREQHVFHLVTVKFELHVRHERYIHRHIHMYMYMLAYVHAFIHTRVHTYMYAHTYVHARAYVRVGLSQKDLVLFL